MHELLFVTKRRLTDDLVQPSPFTYEEAETQRASGAYPELNGAQPGTNSRRLPVHPAFQMFMTLVQQTLACLSGFQLLVISSV